MFSTSKSKTINVIGGTYEEFCYEPMWEQIFGSGLRGALAIRGIDTECEVTLHTLAGPYVKKHLDMHYLDISKEIVYYPQQELPIRFVYQNPLRPPTVYYDDVKYPAFSIKAEHCIMFGMMENSASVESDYVVYDPQSPNSPIPFTHTGSKAKHLCVVLNENEAKIWSGKQSINEIKDYLFTEEGCECVVIKRGAMGAIVYDSPESNGKLIPIYKTNSVWTIGTGDVFSSVFGYFWMVLQYSPVESATLASLAVACYSNSKSLEKLGDQIKGASFKEHIPREKGLVYLAGPFFTMSEREFVSESRKALISAGLSVFSPYHDVGFGGPEDVVPLDIEAIKKCKTIFAILDGMDPGTVFEVGYGVALGKNVVILVENEAKTDLQMMYGTKCHIENDFTTAVYKTCWLTNE